MILTIKGERQVINPAPEQVASALRSLDGVGDSFAILERRPMFYVQTAGDPDDGFLLEYQEGSLDQHFQSVRQDLPLETVEKTFQMYLVNDSSWKSGAEWAPLDLSSDVSGVSPALTLALGLSVALAGLLGWWRTA